MRKNRKKSFQKMTFNQFLEQMLEIQMEIDFYDKCLIQWNEIELSRIFLVLKFCIFNQQKNDL